MAENRNIHYLFRTKNMTDYELEGIKEAYIRKGMKVVVLTEGQGDIHEAIKGVLLNHG